jgi:CheY-like chemotaxis protein
MSNRTEGPTAIPGSAPRRGHALLVEDDELSAVYATAALQRFGWDVSLARDGEEAVNATVDRRFDVIFMDYHLPLRNGLEATKMIRLAEAHAGGPGMPIVGLTASASSEERQQCLNAGMDDVLCKPFLLAEMLQMLDRWVPARVAG